MFSKIVDLRIKIVKIIWRRKQKDEKKDFFGGSNTGYVN